MDACQNTRRHAWKTFPTEHSLNCYLRSIVHNGDIIRGRGHAITGSWVKCIMRPRALINDHRRNGLFSPAGLATLVKIQNLYNRTAFVCSAKKPSPPSLPSLLLGASWKDLGRHFLVRNAISANAEPLTDNNDEILRWIRNSLQDYFSSIVQTRMVDQEQRESN